MATHHEKRMRELFHGGLHDEVIAFYDRCICGLGKNLSILDLGAGNGMVSLSLAEKEYTQSVMAYDRDLNCMRQLPEHLKITKEATGNVTHLPFDSNYFDVVVCRYAFHHFEHKLDTLQEIKRVMKPDGLFLYSDPVLPEHSKHVLNPLYYLREHNFHGYLGYFETIELLAHVDFSIVLSRPYQYKYPSFEKYMEGVDDGFKESPPEGFSDCFKLKLRNGWNNIDKITKMEMGMDMESLSEGFIYHLVDLAIIKQ